MFQTKYVEKIKTHFTFSDFFLSRRVCRLWDNGKNIVDPDRRQMTIWCMRIACWAPKASNADSEYVILTAFPLLRWLHERASVLRYVYTACIVTETEYVYCAVRTESLKIIQPILVFDNAVPWARSLVAGLHLVGHYSIPACSMWDLCWTN
jgi:hypothetical protein